MEYCKMRHAVVSKEKCQIECWTRTGLGLKERFRAWVNCKDHNLRFTREGVTMENEKLIIHRTSDKAKEPDAPKGLWCGQKVLPHTEAQSHTDSIVSCPGCLKVITERAATFCELLQVEITDEECAKCWQDQMAELAREYEAHRLTVGEPRTIIHEDCKKENITDAN